MKTYLMIILIVALILHGGIMYMADVVMWMYLYQTLSKEDKK